MNPTLGGSTLPCWLYDIAKVFTSPEGIYVYIKIMHVKYWIKFDNVFVNPCDTVHVPSYECYHTILHITGHLPSSFWGVTKNQLVLL